MKRIYIEARQNESIEIKDCNTDKLIEKTHWRKYLTNKEWSQCRDGLIIYKQLKTN